MISTQNQYHPTIVFHPGETLAEKLDEMGMGPKEFAVRTGKPEKTVFAILKGKSSITPEMAVQFEHVLKIPAHFWLNKQRHYDEFVARRERHEMLKNSESWARKFPLNEMQNKGWIPDVKSIEENTAALLAFFGFSSHTAWENYYLRKQLKVAFSISLAHSSQPYALSAWLRKGELQAAQLNTMNYSASRFKDVLENVRNLMVEHPPDFFKQLQVMCLDAGVKVVYTPAWPKAAISGATRWLGGNTPVIQLASRYKRNDIFWFTFFHEAGHILLHGKKDIFLENIEHSDTDKIKEKEANDFAVKWTFSKELEEELQKTIPIVEEDIPVYAKKYNTNPAIITGRLLDLGQLHYAVGRKFIQEVDLDS